MVIGEFMITHGGGRSSRGRDLVRNFIKFMGLSSHVDPMIGYSKFGLFSVDSLAIDSPMPFAIQRGPRGHARPPCQTRQFAPRRGRPSRPMRHVDEEAIVRYGVGLFYLAYPDQAF